MIRVIRNNANVNIEFFRPEALTLELPAVAQPLPDIVKGWEHYHRANNLTLPPHVEAFNGPFQSDATSRAQLLGTIVRNGRVTVHTGHNWPGFAVLPGGAIELLEAPRQPGIDAYLVGKQARLAVTAGPWLVRNGAVYDFRRGEWPYADLLDRDILRPRTAIGQRPDGIMFRVIAVSATLQDVAEVAHQVVGASWCLNMDGGGSTSLHRAARDAGMGNARPLAAAFFISAVVPTPADVAARIGAPAPAPEPDKPAPPPIIVPGVPKLAATGPAFGDLAEYIADQLTRHATARYNRRDLTAIDRGVLHHTGVTVLQDAEIIAGYHVRTHGWPGIGYHVYIRRDGRAYQVNDVSAVSHHAKSHNLRGLAFCFEGDMRTQRLTTEQARKGLQLIAYTEAAIPHIRWTGHGTAGSDNYGTECPGFALGDLLAACR